MPALQVADKLPRTNADAVSWWADGILLPARRPYRTVNSIRCEGDSIYSFGHHFPMAKLIRNARGRVTRVVVNADHWRGKSGWAQTNYDHANVLRECRERVSRAPWSIKLEEIKLTDYDWRPVRVRPSIDDIEPDPHPQLTIPVFFYAPHPGPEPVDDGVGCIAGTSEDYSYSERAMIRPEEKRPGDWMLPRPRYALDYIWVERWANGTITYTRKHTYGGGEEKRCPHCRAFEARHDAWKLAMDGGYDWQRSRGQRRVRGRREYERLMARYGSEEGWRIARREDWRRVRRLKARRKEWEARNHVPLAAAPLDRHGIPKFDADGFVSRAAVARYQRIQRKAAKLRAERLAREKAEREVIAERRRLEWEEQLCRIAEAKEAWRAGVGFAVRDEVVEWCVTHGVKPNADQTVTLIKAVSPDTFESNHRTAYAPGTTVRAPDYAPTRVCGAGLHFGPNPAVAMTYHAGPVVFLMCRVPLATLIPLSDKCKADSCFVEGEYEYNNQTGV